MTSVYLSRCSGDAPEEARALLERALRARGLPALPLRRTGAGQPYLEGGPFVSLSHTKGAAAAALGDEPVGVDAEHLRRLSPGLAGRVLSRTELAWYRARGEDTADLLTLWTLKESYYKYLGTGLRGFPNRTDFRLCGGVWRQGSEPLTFRTRRLDGWFFAVCGSDPDVSWIQTGD